MKKHVGEKFAVGEAGSAAIVQAGTRPGHCIVMVEGIEIEVKYSNLQRGMKRSYILRKALDLPSATSTTDNTYSIWRGVVVRATSSYFKELYPSYKNVGICPEWLAYTSFKEWYDKQYKEDGWEIDKDLLSGKENKIYSPSTCVLLPKEINHLLANKRRTNTSGYTGVRKCVGTCKFEVNIKVKGIQKRIGVYGTEEEAYSIYKQERENIAIDMCEKYRGKLPDNIINYIINKSKE